MITFARQCERFIKRFCILDHRHILGALRRNRHILVIFLTIAVGSLPSDGATKASSWPEIIWSPSDFLANIKPGMTENEARTLVHAHRAADIDLHQDPRGIHERRFDLSVDCSLIVRFNSESTVEGDAKISEVMLCRFDSLRTLFPENLYSYIRLIHESSGLGGQQFDPNSEIRCVNGLFKATKAEVFEAMKIYIDVSDIGTTESAERAFDYNLDAERVLLLARLLFVDDGSNNVAPEMNYMVLPGHYKTPPETLVSHLLPSWPMMIENDIPFMLSPGYKNNGAMPSRDLDRYSKSSWIMRKGPLVPIGSPIAAADAITSSLRWKEFFTELPTDDEAECRALVREQAVRAVELGLKDQTFDELFPKAVDSVFST